MTTVREVATPQGPARLHTDRSRHPVATLVLGHGAGGGIDSRDLVALARTLPREGVTVVRVEQPWRVAGKRIAPAPKSIDEALIAAVDQLRIRTPMILGGRSAGARSACRTSHHLGASGCLALSFPLHPPGRPDKSRVEELLGVDVPLLVVQGERDPMGTPEEFPEHVQMTVVPGADHGLKVPKRGEISEEDAMGIVTEAVLELVFREVVGNPSGA